MNSESLKRRRLVRAPPPSYPHRLPVKPHGTLSALPAGFPKGELSSSAVRFLVASSGGFGSGSLLAHACNAIGLDRGAKPSGRSAKRPSTGVAPKLSGSYRFLTIGLRYKVPVDFGPEAIQSARGRRYKVPVDNSPRPQGYPLTGSSLGLTTGGLC